MENLKPKFCNRNFLSLDMFAQKDVNQYKGLSPTSLIKSRRDLISWALRAGFCPLWDKIEVKKVLFLSVLVLCFPGASRAQEALSWEDCLKSASQSHPDLISARQEIRQSNDSKIISASSLWPQADASLSLTQQKSTAGSTSYAYGLSGSQLLFDGFKTFNNVNASSENIKASRENYQYVSSQIRSRLRSAYINLLKQQELIGLTKDIYNIRRQNVELIALRYQAGTEHRGALLTAKANLSQAEFEVHQASRSLKVAQSSLLKEMGRKDSQDIVVQGGLELVNAYDQQPDFEKLLEGNPQWLKLVAKKNAANFDLKSSQANFIPSVSLFGSVGKSEDKWPPSNTSTSVGLRLSWPILEGGSRLAKLDQSKSIIEDLSAQQQALRDTIRLNLQQKWVELQDAIEQVSVQKIFLEAAQERSKIAQQQYSVGLITFDNWTIIEDDLVSRKKIFLNTQVNALLAEANWIEAQGRTLEYEN